MYVYACICAKPTDDVENASREASLEKDTRKLERALQKMKGIVIISINVYMYVYLHMRVYIHNTKQIKCIYVCIC